jgi:hypothetical protein
VHIYDGLKRFLDLQLFQIMWFKKEEQWKISLVFWCKLNKNNMAGKLAHIVTRPPTSPFQSICRNVCVHVGNQPRKHQQWKNLSQVKFFLIIYLQNHNLPFLAKLPTSFNNNSNTNTPLTTIKIVFDINIYYLAAKKYKVVIFIFLSDIYCCQKSYFLYCSSSFSLEFY